MSLLGPDVIIEHVTKILEKVGVRHDLVKTIAVHRGSDTELCMESSVSALDAIHTYIHTHAHAYVHAYAS